MEDSHFPLLAMLRFQHFALYRLSNYSVSLSSNINGQEAVRIQMMWVQAASALEGVLCCGIVNVYFACLLSPLPDLREAVTGRDDLEGRKLFECICAEF